MTGGAMPDDLQALLGEAIAGRQEIRFSYGHDRKTIAPHILYESEEGELFIAGPTQPFGKWHDYIVAAITKLERTGARFDGDAASAADHGPYHKVICSL
jgi:hypothetical protein